MITNKPTILTRILPVGETPFHLRPKQKIMYFVLETPKFPIYITEMHIVNAHPEQKPFPSDSLFEIQSFNLTSQRWGRVNRTFLHHMPIISPFSNFHDYENGYIMKNHSKEDIYFYLKYYYCFKYKF